jgi:hypothetical protein
MTSMTLTLDLPPDLEERLKAEAIRRGLSVADTMIELARSATSELSSTRYEMTLEETPERLTGPWPDDEPLPTTPAEVVACWERHGLIGTRPDITDSLEHTRRLRRKAEGRARS